MPEDATPVFRPGSAPGTLVYVGDRKVEKTRLTLIRYTEDRCDEKELKSPDECPTPGGGDGICWLNVDGLHDVGTIEAIGNRFGLHPLVQEDILNTGQRPKFESSEGYLYLVLKMVRFDARSGNLLIEQVSIIVGDHFVLSFQEAPGDVFDTVRERVRTQGSRIRTNGADFLAYALVDAVVDAYFLVIEKLGDGAESIEEVVFDDPSRRTLQAIQTLRNDNIALRKAVMPLRDVVSGMQRSDSRLLSPGLAPYLADVYDHAVQTMDSVDALRDMISSLRDSYLSSVSNRMNEIMKVLTIIATIFIPITFVAGIYGMNFDTMPELHWKYGYLAAIGLMIAITLGMLKYFKNKDWL